MRCIKNLIVLFVLFFSLLNLNAQTIPQAIQWQKSLGGTDNDDAHSIQQTNDGGYIIAGWSGSNDGDITGHHGNVSVFDFWIVKLDIEGMIQWQKSLGGTDDDFATSIQQTNDGGYIVAGFSLSNDGDVTGHHGSSSTPDSWIVKLDSEGNIQWQKSLGGTDRDEASSIRQTSDGGYIIAGNSQSNDGDVTGNHGALDYWVVKLNSIGNIQWQKSLGGTDEDFATSVQQTNDGGYIVAGISRSIDGDVTGHHGSTSYADYWVVKLDTVGNLQWQKSLGGTGDDQANSVQQTNDGGYIIAGSSDSNDEDVTGHHGTTGGGYYDYWVVKLDAAGVLQWQKSFGSTGNENGNSIQQTSDGGYIVAGFAQNNDGDVTGHHGYDGFNDFWILKLHTSGNIQWQECLGGSFNDGANTIQKTNDGSFVVAGFSESTDGDVTGYHGGYGGDYWVVKSDLNIGIEEQLIAYSKVSIYPNPSNRKFTVNFPTDTKYIQISNSLGQVMEQKLIAHQTEMNFEIKHNGLYFVQIVSDKETITEKLVISNE